MRWGAEDRDWEADSKLDADFGFIREFLARGGRALMGVGSGKTVARAVESALRCPLLEEGAVESAQKMILLVSAPEQSTLKELGSVNELLLASHGKDAEFLHGFQKTEGLPSATYYAMGS